MALAAAFVWEVRTTGSDTNGGGFKAGASGTDFSQQDAAQFTPSGLTTVGVTTVIAYAAAASTMVGNIINITGGTNFIAGWYEITAVSVGVSITVDRNCTTGSGAAGTANIGGAFASPGQMGSVAVAGNSGWIKAGTYTYTNSTANTSGGPFSFTLGGSSPTSPSKWEGYQTTRGDMGTPPVISAGARTGITVFNVSVSNYNIVVNITVDGNSGASNTGLIIDSPRSQGIKLGAQNCTVKGIAGGPSNSDGNLYRCWATGCSGTCAIEISGEGGRLEAYNNTTTGIKVNPGGAGSSMTIWGSISSGNTGGSSVGYDVGGRNINFTGNIAYGNGSHGFNLGNASGVMENNIAEANVGTGFYAAGSTIRSIYMFNNAYYNNTAGNVDAGLPNNFNGVLGTSSFFVSAATGNFALNNTASAGNSARAAGYPGLSPRGATTGYLDIGAFQHQDSGGGTGPIGQARIIQAAGSM